MGARDVPRVALLCGLVLAFGQGCCGQAHQGVGKAIGAVGIATMSVGAALATGCVDVDEDDHDACEHSTDEGNAEAGLPLVGAGAVLLGIGALADALE